MTSIAKRVAYKFFAAALLFLIASARLHAQALNEPTFKLYGNSRTSYASTQQPQDVRHEQSKADAVLEEAQQLRSQGSVESLRKAVEKYGEALLLYRSVADRQGEVTTLLLLGLAYKGLGEHRKALDSYNRALPLLRAVRDGAGEAATLLLLGRAYDDLGEKQKALAHYNQALPLFRAVRNRRHEATTLINIGRVYADLGENQKAVNYYTRALLLSRALGDRTGESWALNNLGKVYSDLGAKQKALDYYNQALPISRAVDDRAGEAATLHNLGRVYDDLGEKQKALDYYNQASPLFRAVDDRASEATTLSNIGKVYSDLGEKQKALDYWYQVLPIFRLIADRVGETATLHNIGAVYDALGEKQKALAHYNQVLPFFREMGMRGGEASTLNGIGKVYNDLGEKRKALDYMNQALLIFRLMGDRGGEAGTLSNIGAVYHDLEEKPKALHYMNQALLIFREVGSRGGEAATLSNIGKVYDDLGEKQKALDHYNQALPLTRMVGGRAGEATILNHLAFVYAELGENEKALAYYNQALPLRRAVGDRAGEAITLSNIMRSWKEKNPAFAIFYGKQAVNIFQQLRANISGLDKALQQTFLDSNEDVYRFLADLLISEGRLPEAQQVLNMLKEEEYVQFVRRDANAAALAAARIAFSPAEADLEKRFNELIGRLAVIGSERSALLAKRRRSLAEEKVLSQLEQDLVAANQGFQKFLDQLDSELKKTTPGRNDVFFLREAQSLMDTLREINAVALYTVVGKDYYRLILITPDFRKAYEYAIKDTELRHKIFAFRQTLQDPKKDPLPQAQELYRILIGPTLAHDLSLTKTQVLMWSLDDTLRYLPVAALHDGRGYIVERYSNVVFTPASHTSLKDPVSPKWQALGLGVSKGEVLNRVEFPPLPGVREELSAIVRDETKSGSQKGVLPGKVMLDEDFTAEAMTEVLRLKGNEQPYKLVHIASHFNFEPGDETQSFLLLGRGKMLTLAELAKMTQIFSRVELLTLSACNTATGGVKAQGAEVEGFAVLAQRQGADAIIASLWKVADPSTSRLMRTFYRLRDQHPGMSKAEALRQAQLTLLGPEVQQVNTGDPKRLYAHPYFWAPFILIGNWR